MHSNADSLALGSYEAEVDRMVYHHAVSDEVAWVLGAHIAYLDSSC